MGLYRDKGGSKTDIIKIIMMVKPHTIYEGRSKSKFCLYHTKFPLVQIIPEMELVIKLLLKSEIWAVIWFLFTEKVPTTLIRFHLVVIYGENVMSVQMIRKWYQQLKTEREWINSEPCAGLFH